MVALVIRWLRRGSRFDALLLAWAGPYFILTGLLYAKHLRYMLPLVPILCLLAAEMLVQIREILRQQTRHSARTSVIRTRPITYIRMTKMHTVSTS